MFSMKGFEVVKQSQVLFTSKLAQEILSLERFVGDRDVKESWVDHLGKEMSNKNFVWELVTILSCTHKGKEYRLNCQHVSCAVLEHFGTNFKSTGRVNYIRLKTNSDEALRKLYAVIDNNKPRTFYDKVVARMYGTKELGEISKDELKKIGSGYANYLSGGIKNTYDLDIIAENMMNDHQDSCMKIHKMLKEQKKSSPMWRTPIVAAMFYTLDQHPKEFRKFWNGVLNPSSLVKDDARYTLNALILGDPIVHRQLTLSGSIRSFIFKSCIYAYIRWAKNEKIRGVKQLTKLFDVNDLDGMFVLDKK